ncbi:MAG: hypothetical protein JWO38_5560 [Gemmataceae bacterium]|nr:hypothetical protein [Gemmataceae bacterium]
MRRMLAVVGLVLTAGWTAGAADDDAAKAAKKLEGSYQVVEATRGGKPDPKGKEVKSFTIKNGTIVISAGDRDETAKFTVDPSKTPAHIDLVPKDDHSVPGIYAVKETDKGLELTIAFTKGANESRPKDFKGEGEGDIVIKLLRKKEK